MADLEQFPRSTLQKLIQDPSTDAALLDRIARMCFNDTPLMKDLIQHPCLADETLEFLFRTASPEIQEGLKLRFKQSLHRKEAVGAANSFGPSQVESFKKGEVGTSENVYQAIRQMTVAEKMQFAIRADKEARSILVRDSNKQVALAVLESPKLTEQEVESIAQSRNVSDDVLRAISKKREWLKNYTIVHSLVNNPRTPPGIAITLVPQLKPKDLGLLLKNRSVSEAVRTHAAKLFKSRAQT